MCEPRKKQYVQRAVDDSSELSDSEVEICPLARKKCPQPMRNKCNYNSTGDPKFFEATEESTCFNGKCCNDPTCEGPCNLRRQTRIQEPDKFSKQPKCSDQSQQTEKYKKICSKRPGSKGCKKYPPCKGSCNIDTSSAMVKPLIYLDRPVQTLPPKSPPEQHQTQSCNTDDGTCTKLLATVFPSVTPMNIHKECNKNPPCQASCNIELLPTFKPVKFDRSAQTSFTYVRPEEYTSKIYSTDIMCAKTPEAIIATVTPTTGITTMDPRRIRSRKRRSNAVKCFYTVLIFFMAHGIIAALAKEHEYYSVFLAAQLIGFITYAVSGKA